MIFKVFIFSIRALVIGFLFSACNNIEKTNESEKLLVSISFLTHKNDTNQASLSLRLYVDDFNKIYSKELKNCNTVTLFNEFDTVSFHKGDYFFSDNNHSMVITSPIAYELDSSNYNRLFDRTVFVIFNTIVNEKFKVNEYNNGVKDIKLVRDYYSPNL
jgi:hypothetical protein